MTDQVTLGPPLKPWRKQKEWLSDKLLHSSPKAEFCFCKGNPGAQLEHPKGGSLTWVRSPFKHACGVEKIDGKWRWLLQSVAAQGSER